MPNSDSTITRLNLIKRSFRRIGIQRPSVTDISNAVGLLNGVIKGLDTEGRWLWAINNTASTLTLSASTASYSAGSGASKIATNILALENVEIVEGVSRTRLNIISKSESISTLLREGTGKPVAVILEKFPVMTNQKMTFFQTPNGTHSVEYTYRRRLYDFDAPTDNPDFPQDWEQRLVKILSYELSPEYGIPLQEREILRMEAENAINKGLAANTESGADLPTKTVYF